MSTTLIRDEATGSIADVVKNFGRKATVSEWINSAITRFNVSLQDATGAWAEMQRLYWSTGSLYAIPEVLDVAPQGGTNSIVRFYVDGQMEENALYA